MYPPFVKILRILFTSEDENLAKDAAKVYYEEVKKIQAEYKQEFVYLGAMKAPIGRIQNKHRLQILTRIKTQKADEITNKLFELADKLKKSNVSIFVEINPQNLS
jgi:primosomal protein N'